MGIVERLNKASAHASRARDSNAIDEAVAFIERVGKVMDEVQWNSYDDVNSPRVSGRSKIDPPRPRRPDHHRLPPVRRLRM